MSKLTKSEIKAHTAAVGLLDRRGLSDSEILFVFENYREDATHINSKAGAFFTPFWAGAGFGIPYPDITRTKDKGD